MRTARATEKSQVTELHSGQYSVHSFLDHSMQGLKTESEFDESRILSADCVETGVVILIHFSQR